MTSPYTAAESATMRREYESGLSVAKVGARHYCDASTARKHIIRAGGTMRPQRAPRGNVAMMQHDWNGGASVERIAKIYGYKNINSVYGVIYRSRRMGLEFTRRKA